jgi:hypothetical protein
VRKVYDPPVVRTLAPLLGVLSALALGGCGSGGESDGGGAGTGADTRGAAYEAAFDICRGGLKATAEAYAVPATEEAVTAVIVEQVSGGSPEEEQNARQGCLDAMKQAGG